MKTPMNTDERRFELWRAAGAHVSSSVILCVSVTLWFKATDSTPPT